MDVSLVDVLPVEEVGLERLNGNEIELGRDGWWRFSRSDIGIGNSMVEEASCGGGEGKRGEEEEAGDCEGEEGSGTYTGGE